MADKAKGLVHALHLVKLTGSLSNKHPRIRQTLLALGLRKRMRPVVHKNTPMINGMLDKVRDLVKVTPIMVREEAIPRDRLQAMFADPNSPTLLSSRGDFFNFVVSDETVPPAVRTAQGQIREEIEEQSMIPPTAKAAEALQKPKAIPVRSTYRLGRVRARHGNK